MFVGLCEREIAKNKSMVTAILKSVRKFKIKNIPNNTELVRNILKDINMSAGLTMYDALSNEEIQRIVENIFSKNINK